MRKIYNILFLLFFMFFITVPSVKHITFEDRVRSEENRILKQLPELPQSIESINNYTSNMDDYLSDQFGFRRNFISVVNKLRFKLFNEISSNQITVGKEGFIYFNSHIPDHPNSLIKSICNITIQSAKFQNRVKNSFVQFVDHFRKLGIIANLAIIPTKSKIYPEHLPNLLRSWCSMSQPTWQDDLFHQLINNHVYYPLNKMLKMKETIQVYLPKQFHWNGIMPYIIAEDIMMTLWNIEPSFVPTPKTIIIPSDLRYYFNGLHFYDKSLNFDYNDNDIKTCYDNNCLNELSKYYKQGNSSIYSIPNSTTSDKLVILSDSFGSFIAKNFIRGFSEVILIDISNLEIDEQYLFYNWLVKSINPTHFLFLIHDGGIYGNTINFEYFLNEI